MATAVGIEVIYHNERYTSKDAEEHIRDNLGIRDYKKVRELVDKMAACMILSNYLEEQK